MELILREETLLYIPNLRSDSTTLIHYRQLIILGKNVYLSISTIKAVSSFNPSRAKDGYIRPHCTLRANTVHAPKQPTTYIYLLSLFHLQPSELSLSNQGCIYTSKIVNFSNHVKIWQQPKEFLEK